MHSLGDFLCAATIISAKWKMFIQRKKYRQLRDAGQSPCDYPLHSLTFISHLYFNSFPIFTPSLSPSFIPSSLHSLPLLHPHSLTPSLPHPVHILTLFLLYVSPSLHLSHTHRDCVCQALEEDQGSALHPQAQGGSGRGQKVSQHKLLRYSHTTDI